MARLVPDFSLFNPHDGIRPLERKTLSLLEKELSDQYLVFHNIHWTTPSRDKTILGEIDFIVMAPSRRLLLIEQKNGLLNESFDGLSKSYKRGPKSIEGQISRNVSNLLELFKVRADLEPDLDFLLYCPDYEVRNTAIAGIAPDRIVDQSKAAFLPEIIDKIFEERGVNANACTDYFEIEDFLSNQLKVRYDIGFLGELAKSAYVQQAAGLSDWVGKLSGDPFRLVVEATAGSGKTQLCLDEIKQAKAAEQNVLYVCFNRSLAEDMKKAAGDSSTCTTFHELAKIVYESSGNTFDPNQPGIFPKIADFLVGHIAEIPSDFDVLLIDEGQDFDAEWIQALQHLVKPGGRSLLMQDPNQSLYERTAHDLKGWMKLSHQVTYRCPRTVTDLVNELELCPEPVISESQIEGLEPFIETYESDSESSLIEATSNAVQKFLDEGHPSSDIAVLTIRGERSSRILKESEIAGVRVKKIIGRDEHGNFIWSEGQLTCDTVFRFKGRSANCVVLTEVDFEELDDNTARRLFVGLSRARLGVGLVLGSGAVRVFSQD